ncbi:MAG: 30S ribosomal protein S18 [bacterium]|nr:30S ribosomal protein S18 [bacterium]
MEKRDGKGKGWGYEKRKVCRLCVDKVKEIDYKDVGRLRKFISDRGKIMPRRVNRNCTKHQRMVAKAIKRARNIALLPFCET